MELMMLGFWIVVWGVIASIAISLFFYLLFGIFYVCAWALGKLTGKDYL